MKVLWFSHIVPYPATGLGVLQRAYHLVRELSRAHEVHLLAFVQRQIIEELLGDVEEGLQRAREHLIQYCAQVEFLSIPSERNLLGRHWLAARSLVGGHPYTMRWLLSKWARRRAMEWNASVGFEVVHFDTLSLAPYEDIFRGQARSLDHHNIESAMMLRRARLEGNPLKRAYFWQEGMRLRNFERRVCPQFDLNITCSQLDSDRLEAIVPGLKTTVVPNGVDTEYFRPEIADQLPLSLVFAGNMAWYPNRTAMLYFAERVWPALQRQVPGIVMDVVGGNPPQALVSLAARDKAFRVHGFVPDVRPYIGRASIYVCPITDGGGTKLKILDALAMGKPIVAHPVACEGIAVRDGDEVLFASRPEEFVQRIVTLLGDPRGRMRLCRLARSLAEASYSYAVIGRKLVCDFESLSAFGATSCRDSGRKR